MAVREAEPVESLQEVKEAGLDREDPPRDVPQHAHHARHRGARPHPLQAGKDSRLVLHGARQRGLGGRCRDGDGAERRRHAAPARHGGPRDARHRAVARVRAVHGPRGRPDEGAGREHPHGRRPTRAAHDGEPPPGDAPGCGRNGARVQDSRRETRRGRLVRRRSIRPRGRARGHELGGRPPAPGRLRDRQQPVGLLHAVPPSSTRSTTSPTAPRPTASTASSSTAPTCSRCTARRSARSRRPARAAARR